MPNIQHGIWRTLTGYFFLSLPLIFGFILFSLISPHLKPVQLTEEYQGTRITYAADRQWVWLPGNCVDIEWTLENAAGATFFPKVEPGIREGEGVRSVFFRSRDYRPGLTILEDAKGGITETFTRGETITRAGSGCVDSKTEPKLRVLFQDGSSGSYKLGLDAIFLRLEIWLLVLGAISSVFIGTWLLQGLTTARFLQLSLWISAAFLLFFGAVLLQYPDFIRTNQIDVPIFFILATGTMGGAIYSVVRPDGLVLRLRALKSVKTIYFAVTIFWLWVLSFGHAAPGHTSSNGFFWLPFFVWAFLVGFGLLWWKRQHEDEGMTVATTKLNARLLLALLCFGVSMARDVILIQEYGIRIVDDSRRYVVDGSNFVVPEQTDRLPKRIFPYVLLNFATQSSANPIPLLALQSFISAASAALLAYVLSYKYLWFGAGVGLLLALNFGMGSFNATLSSESTFVSFHMICFAIIVSHIQRRGQLRVWELLAFGLLCGWTFLNRGTGLGLVLPALLVYVYITRSWLKSLAFLAGFLAFLLIVVGYNQWRYGQAGLIGPQDSTLASALFSYHLFSPDNGKTSQAIDTSLRDCMGYLDYDDVPRHFNLFIYGAFEPCLFSTMSSVEVASATSSALRELVLHRPFDFSRVLVEEVGVGLAYPAFDLFYRFSTGEDSVAILDHNCRRLYGQLCDQFPDNLPPSHVSIFTSINRILAYPSQLYLAAEQISLPSPAVILAAFMMLNTLLYTTTKEKLLVLWCVGFVFYQLLTISIVHVFIPRYGIILTPFFVVLSVLAIGTSFQFLTRLKATRGWWIAAAFICFYISLANPFLQRYVSAPILARININLFQKYGIEDIDFAAYRELISRSTSAFFPETEPSRAQALWQFGTVYHPFDLPAPGQLRVKGWEFTRLPGYLRDVGASYLLLDAEQWASLPPPDQAILADSMHYRLIGEWHDENDSRRLFEIVGDARGTYPVHDQNDVVVFEQPDRSLDVYRLDEDRNGVFLTHIDLAAVESGTLNFEGVGGWTIELQPLPTGGYTLSVRDADDAVADSSFIVYLP